MSPLPEVLAYHKVGTIECGATWCTRAQLRAHLDALRAAGLRAVDLATFESRLGEAERGAGEWAPDTLEALVTFDDAFASFAAHAWPELERARVPAVLFVVAEFVGRRATWDWPLPGRRVPHLDWPALRDLARAGVTIGAHSATHRDLRRAPSDALERELAGARARLEDELGVAVTSVAYPFGRTDARVETAARQAGYTTGFAMWSAAGAVRRFALRRHGVYAIDGPRAVLDKLDRRRPGHAWQAGIERAATAGASLVARLPPLHTAG